MMNRNIDFEFWCAGVLPGAGGPALAHYRVRDGTRARIRGDTKIREPALATLCRATPNDDFANLTRCESTRQVGGRED